MLVGSSSVNNTFATTNLTAPTKLFLATVKGAEQDTCFNPDGDDQVHIYVANNMHYHVFAEEVVAVVGKYQNLISVFSNTSHTPLSEDNTTFDEMKLKEGGGRLLMKGSTLVKGNELLNHLPLDTQDLSTKLGDVPVAYYDAEGKLAIKKGSEFLAALPRIITESKKTRPGGPGPGVSGVGKGFLGVLCIGMIAGVGFAIFKDVTKRPESKSRKKSLGKKGRNPKAKVAAA